MSMKYRDWREALFEYAEKKDYYIDPDDNRLGDLYEECFTPDDAVRELMQEAYESWCLYSRAPW
jgi:hypothetical protein